MKEASTDVFPKGILFFNCQTIYKRLLLLRKIFTNADRVASSSKGVTKKYDIYVIIGQMEKTNLIFFLIEYIF